MQASLDDRKMRLSIRVLCSQRAILQQHTTADLPRILITGEQTIKKGKR